MGEFVFEVVESAVEKAALIDHDSARVRAAKLRARMLQFRDVYNAAWFVRGASHGRPVWREEKCAKFVEVLRREIDGCKDPEALIYAVADALTAYPRGLPWEG